MEGKHAWRQIINWHKVVNFTVLWWKNQKNESWSPSYNAENLYFVFKNVCSVCRVFIYQYNKLVQVRICTCHITIEFRKIYSSLVWLCEENEKMYSIQNDNGYERKGNCGIFLPTSEIWDVREHLRLNSQKKTPK